MTMVASTARALIPIGLAVLWVTLAPRSATACVCRLGPEDHIDELVAQADAVFYGRVKRIGEGPPALCLPDTEGSEGKDPRWGDICAIDPEACPPIPCPIAHVKVIETFKGQAGKHRIVVPTPGGSMACDADYEVGQTYLVIGTVQEGYVYSWQCASHAVTPDSASLKQLGYESRSGRNHGCAGCAVGGRSPGPAPLLLLSLAWWATVRRRRSRR